MTKNKIRLHLKKAEGVVLACDMLSDTEWHQVCHSWSNEEFNNLSKEDFLKRTESLLGKLNLKI